VGVESTIVGFEDERPVVYRLGGVSVEELQRLCEQPVRVELNQSSNPAAPGMLKSHYAPSKPLHLLEAGAALPQRGPRVGLISLVPRGEEAGAGVQVSLCPDGVVAPGEAARRLFAALRTMDGAECDVIYAERCPEEGLGRAVNDRLKRAAAK
jgi:L-threonylcarbamoyladenylate synthase